MENNKRALQKNRLEWMVFVLSAILVAGVLGYLIYATLTLGNAPPAVKIEIGKSDSHGEYFRVPVTIKNDGDRTAEGVAIEIVLERNGKEIETSEFEITFLPRHSSREAEVTFKADPRAGKLKARVLGYEKP